MEKFMLKILSEENIDVKSDNVYAFTLGKKSTGDFREAAVVDDGKPKLPTYCCNNFCSNCVWIEYMKELRRYLEKNGEFKENQIDKMIDNLDINSGLKAFLKIEMKWCGLNSS